MTKTANFYAVNRFDDAAQCMLDLEIDRCGRGTLLEIVEASRPRR